MSEEYEKNKSPNEKQQKELFRDLDQTDIPNEYDFFLPEPDTSVESLQKPVSSGEKERDGSQENELLDFFLLK